MLTSQNHVQRYKVRTESLAYSTLNIIEHCKTWFDKKIKNNYFADHL